LECGAWGSLKESESAESAPERPHDFSKTKSSTLTPFSADTAKSAPATPTRCAPIDLVLGGGLVAGSVTLIAGEPGIGKSTLLSQAAIAIAASGRRVMYVTGEESPAQIRRRLERLSPKIPDGLLFLDDTDAQIIAATIVKEKPDLAIVDSIQSVRLSDVNGDAGSVTQVKACAATITEAAKKSHVPVVFVGQVTKDGDVAGPRVLEHLVDAVLYLEGDKDHRYRILRALKHRFGSTDETALLTMSERGLEPVEDPSSELLKDRATNTSGSAIGCIIEGHRPMLIELQALVSPAGYGTPIRRATGVDPQRLGMLLAVIAKRAGIYALDKDVYANAAGGIDARDQSVDLAVAVAVASAVKEKPIDPRTGIIGEIGLGGELRPISLPELRLKEFARMGFQTVIVPKRQGAHAPKGLHVIEASTLREALDHLLF
jgi:DNA repair protein RadA/Sms